MNVKTEINEKPVAIDGVDVWMGFLKALSTKDPYDIDYEYIIVNKSWDNKWSSSAVILTIY